MSEETKTNEPVKQEGDFKLKSKKTTPKKLGNINNDPVKVDLTKPEATGEIEKGYTKVTIPSEEIKKEDNAIRIGETETVDVGEQTGDSAKMDEQVQESSETIEESSPIQEITEEYKITTVINTHDMNSVMEIGQKIIFLKNGVKEWEGSNKEIFKTDNESIVDFASLRWPLFVNSNAETTSR